MKSFLFIYLINIQSGSQKTFELSSDNFFQNEKIIGFSSSLNQILKMIKEIEVKFNMKKLFRKSHFFKEQLKIF